MLPLSSRTYFLLMPLLLTSFLQGADVGHKAAISKLTNITWEDYSNKSLEQVIQSILKLKRTTAITQEMFDRCLQIICADTDNVPAVIALTDAGASTTATNPQGKTL
ncbi:MAG TPA: hypothetical protein VLG71_01485, partial [Candidatus Limnocylindria bacterium]|nr:hypothetical protein [Candidatus Limnocylindria bacterium]